MNNKGIEQLTLMFRFIVVSFLAVVLFAGLLWATGLLNTQFHDIGVANEGSSLKVNLTKAAETTFGQMNNSAQALRLVAICLIFSEILLVFVFSAFQRTHPALFIVWVFIVFFAVMLAAPVSNAYESLLQQNLYGGLLESFTGGTWFLLNLPWIVLLVGIIGGIFMFINLVKNREETGL